MPSDVAASTALLHAFRWLAEHLPEGRVLRHDGVLPAVTGVPLAGLNGVWAPAGGADLDSALSAVAVIGLPYCAEFPVGEDRAAEVVAARGMSRDEDVPLMRLDGEPRASREPRPPMRVRRLAPDEARLHAEVASAGFGAPLELFEPLATPELLSHPELAVYVGEVDGAPVTTGVGLRTGDSVGVFNVATPPSSRRRGYGPTSPRTSCGRPDPTVRSGPGCSPRRSASPSTRVSATAPSPSGSSGSTSDARRARRGARPSPRAVFRWVPGPTAQIAPGLGSDPA